MRSINSIDQMYAVVKTAVLTGINHIETAPAYGPAETFLGESLKRLQEEAVEPTDGWVITSKLLPGLSLEEGKQHLRSILSRLGFVVPR